MSVTPGFGGFNAGKVANKFGIQLKAKDGNKQSQPSLSPTSEKKLINTETSIIAKNKSENDFDVENQSNGFQSKSRAINHSPLSKSPEPMSKTPENAPIELTSTINERRNSLISNVNHSTSLNPVKQNPSPETVKRLSLTPTDRSLSPESSSIKRTVSPEPSSVKQIPAKTVSPEPTMKQSSHPTKSEAQIEHQKDQPLYKRQLSKALDPNTSMTNKTKHQHELTTTPITTSNE